MLTLNTVASGVRQHNDDANIQGQSVFGGSARLIFGRGLSVSLGFLVAPIISRLYQPETFGLFAFTVQLSSWIGAFATLAYAQAIPMTNTRQESRRSRSCA